MQSSKVQKIAGVLIALVGIKLFTAQKLVQDSIKPSFGWWGVIGGIILIGFGWGLYDMGRSKTKGGK